jgi:tripartite-type tricarboxylate transporter receptor subunit TctC
MNKALGRGFMALAAVLAATSGAFAQDYPARPIKMIVGFVAGGGPDVVARGFAQKLGEVLGQPVVVENRPGAGATTATAQVSKMPADGYTLLVGETSQLFVAPYVYKNLQYDTVRDFTPISMVATTAVMVVSTPGSSIKTLQDLIREATARPGKIDFGSSGIGTIHHIVMSTFMEDSGIDMQHIPFKGSGQSVVSALAGEVPVLATSAAGAGVHVAAGKLNPLAVSTSFRLPGYPNVPSIGEFVKGYDFASEVGFLAPPGLPAPILSKLSAAVKKVSEMAEVTEGLRKSGLIVRYTTPAEYAENIRVNLKKYERAVRIAKIPLAD